VGKEGATGVGRREGLCLLIESSTVIVSRCRSGHESVGSAPSLFVGEFRDLGWGCGEDIEQLFERNFPREGVRFNWIAEGGGIIDTGATDQSVSSLEEEGVRKRREMKE
jgi:hypothetical protein